MTQKFKGDQIELNIESAGSLPFDFCSAALDEYFDGCYEASDFLLAQYDAGKMPFSDRVPRDSFVAFIKQAIPNFPVTGTFESYIFIIQSIFGEGSGILFNVPAAGKLSMIVNAASSLEFDLVAREFVDGAYVLSTFATIDGFGLQSRGISGIDSQAKLTQLLSELIPAGVFPDITLAFFALYSFASSSGDLMIDNLGNQIVFFETGE